MERTRGFALAVLLAPGLGLAGCGGGESPTSPVAVAVSTPGFELQVDNAAPPGAQGCASTVLTVSSGAGFSGALEFDCVGPPAGVKCGFGAMPSLAPSSRRRVGLTVSADLTVPNGTHAFRLRARSERGERSVDMRVSLSRVIPIPVSRGMTATGCAGYADGILGAGFAQSYHAAIVGAWRDAYRGRFCIETLAAGDGSFLLGLSDRCFRAGEPVYWTAGGLDTCVVAPFRSGEVLFVDLLGRREPCP